VQVQMLSEDHFAQLPADCVTLVLQPLDNTSRLAAAATCKRMFSDTLQPLAWKHTEPLRITDEQLQVQQYRQHAAHSLLQLAPVHLLLQDEYVPPSCLQLGCIRHLERLEQGQHYWADLSPLLPHPATQQLHQLKLSEHGARIPENWRLTSALPHLSSLDVSSSTAEWSPQLREAIGQCLAQLLARAQLTELALHGFSSTNGDSILLPLLQSAGHLRSLHLGCIFLWQAGADTVSQFASLGAALPHLQEFSAAQFRSSTVPTAEGRRLFSTLRSLHTLRLVHCDEVDALLPLLTKCAQLRHLHIVAHSMVASMKPSLDALAVLQAALPQLRIESTENFGDNRQWYT